MVGEGGIEPPTSSLSETRSNRLSYPPVNDFWPLLSFYSNNQLVDIMLISGTRDSNSRPLGPKPSALAIWASPRHRMVPGGRIELPTQGFSGLCSTPELPWHVVVSGQHALPSPHNGKLYMYIWQDCKCLYDHTDHITPKNSLKNNKKTSVRKKSTEEHLQPIGFCVSVHILHVGENTSPTKLKSSQANIMPASIWIIMVRWPSGWRRTFGVRVSVLRNQGSNPCLTE